MGVEQTRLAIFLCNRQRFLSKSFRSRHTIGVIIRFAPLLRSIVAGFLCLTFGTEVVADDDEYDIEESIDIFVFLLFNDDVAEREDQHDGDDRGRVVFIGKEITDHGFEQATAKNALPPTWFYLGLRVCAIGLLHQGFFLVRR